MKRLIMAALVCGIVYWVIQAAWFTIFSAPWVAGLGWSAEEVERITANPSMMPYVLALIGNVAMALVIGKVIEWSGARGVMGGARIGAMLWAGLVLAAFVTEFSFEYRPWRFIGIAAGAVGVGMVVMGGILGAWVGSGAARVEATAPHVPSGS